MVQSCDFHAPTASVMKEYCIEVLFKRTEVSFANIGSFVHTYMYFMVRSMQCLTATKCSVLYCMYLQ